MNHIVNDFSIMELDDEQGIFLVEKADTEEEACSKCCFTDNQRACRESKCYLNEENIYFSFTK